MKWSLLDKNLLWFKLKTVNSLVETLHNTGTVREASLHFRYELFDILLEELAFSMFSVIYHLVINWISIQCAQIQFLALKWCVSACIIHSIKYFIGDYYPRLSVGVLCQYRTDSSTPGSSIYKSSLTMSSLYRAWNPTTQQGVYWADELSRGRYSKQRAVVRVSIECLRLELCIGSCRGSLNKPGNSSLI